jgi:hypothetical protein
MIRKLAFVLLLVVIASPVYAAQRRRAVLPPETPWFHAAIWVRQIPPPDQITLFYFVWPERGGDWEDGSRLKETVTTRAGEVILSDHASYCFCTSPIGSALYLSIPNKDGSAGDLIKHISPDVLPGVVEYRLSISKPSGRHGEISFQIWADDNDHWHFIGGPVTTTETKPGGAVLLRGLFLTDPTVLSSSRRGDVRDWETVSPQTGGVVEVAPVQVGPLPSIISVCSAVSTSKPNSLHCSIATVE